MKRLWSLFASIKTAIVLFFMIALTSIIGTLIEQQPTFHGYERIYGPTVARIIKIFELYDMYHSWWFQLLLVLFAVNLFVCSVDRLPKILRFFRTEEKIKPVEFSSSLEVNCKIKTRKKMSEAVETVKSVLLKHGFSPKIERVDEKSAYFFSEKGLVNRLGVYVTHFSILIILAGGLIGSLFGFTGNMAIVEGGKTRNVVLKGGLENLILPFDVKCDSFEIVYYKNNPEVPKAYISHLEIIENGKTVLKKEVKVNHPLKYKGIYFYQSSYGVFSTEDGVLKLELVDKKTGDKYALSIRLGETKEIDETPYSVKFLAFYPDFVITADGQPATRSDELRNPAALLELFENKRSLGRIWVFAFFPNIHAKENVPFKFRFVSFKPTFYTVLQVSKDPGVWLVWIGCVIMVIAIFITFFVSHRRVFAWVLKRDKVVEVVVGFTANRNREAFKKTASEVCKELKEKL